MTVTVTVDGIRAESVGGNKFNVIKEANGTYEIKASDKFGVAKSVITVEGIIVAADTTTEPVTPIQTTPPVINTFSTVGEQLQRKVELQGTAIDEDLQKMQI